MIRIQQSGDIGREKVGSGQTKEGVLWLPNPTPFLDLISQPGSTWTHLGLTVLPQIIEPVFPYRYITRVEPEEYLPQGATPRRVQYSCRPIFKCLKVKKTPQIASLTVVQQMCLIWSSRQAVF